MMRYLIGSLVALVAFSPQPSSAEVGLARVAQGATGKEVAALMGEPTDRIERETRREQVWIYPAGSVVFVAGKARSVYINGSEQDRFSEEYRRSVELAKPVVQKPISSPVEDILTEILKEVPSETGADGAAGDMKPVEIR